VELLSFEQDQDGVTALLQDLNDKEKKTFKIRASYLVAADGYKSSIRETLGIQREGYGLLRTLRSVLFRAPLEEYLKSGFVQFDINNPDLKAFLTTYGDGRWVLMFLDDKERDEKTLRNLITKALGREDLKVDIITTGRWELSALIAKKFQSGRVFLAGDSAHTLPPNRGGYGANTGIEDVHNLAWKLSAVLSGTSKPELLDSYEAERRPIAWLRYHQIFARPDYQPYVSQSEAKVQIIDEVAMELGQLYRSDCVLGVDSKLPPAMIPEKWEGQPGTRAPHLWISKKNEKLSTLDLLQRTWVLFAKDEKWKSIAIQVSKSLGIELECLIIGLDFQIPSNEKQFLKSFGLKEGGASLIRPDGYVAWRTVDMPEDPTLLLTDALSQISFTTKVIPELKTKRSKL